MSSQSLRTITPEELKEINNLRENRVESLRAIAQEINRLSLERIILSARIAGLYAQIPNPRTCIESRKHDLIQYLKKEGGFIFFCPNCLTLDNEAISRGIGLVSPDDMGKAIIGQLQEPRL